MSYRAMHVRPARGAAAPAPAADKYDSCSCDERRRPFEGATFEFSRALADSIAQLVGLPRSASAGGSHFRSRGAPLSQVVWRKPATARLGTRDSAQHAERRFARSIPFRRASPPRMASPLGAAKPYSAAGKVLFSRLRRYLVARRKPSGAAAGNVERNRAAGALVAATPGRALRPDRQQRLAPAAHSDVLPRPPPTQHTILARSRTCGQRAARENRIDPSPRAGRPPHRRVRETAALSDCTGSLSDCTGSSRGGCLPRGAIASTQQMILADGTGSSRRSVARPCRGHATSDPDGRRSLERLAVRPQNGRLRLQLAHRLLG